MRAYEAYKQIDLPWLDRIPAHWRVQRAKTFFKVINERSVEGKEELLSVSSTQGVIKRNDANVTMFQAESYAGYKLCWPKDLVVNSLWAWQNGLGFSNYYGIVSTAYSVYRLKNSHANYHYYNYLLRSSAFQWELRIRSKGIWKSRYILSDEDFLNSPIICPPREEQDAIVRFLDAKCAKIDRLIKLKERQIALLNEKKQLIINQTVTRGLDPNVPVKDSGVDYIGMIPSHWQVILNHRLWEEKTRSYFAPETVLSLSQQDGVIPYEDMTERSLHTSSYENWKLVLPGDLVVNRFKAHLGVFFSSGYRGIVTFHYGVFKFKMEGSTKYYEYLYHTSESCRLYASLSNGMTVGLQNLSNSHFYSAYSIYPPAHEQKEIVEKVEAVNAVYKTKIKIIEKEILTLREYKTKIISDCVTGKLNCIAGNDTNLGENHV